jgi:hypothetical protein
VKKNAIFAHCLTLKKYSMEKLDYKELLAMLVVVYKRLDDLERKEKGNSRSFVSSETYLNELRKAASNINIK